MHIHLIGIGNPVTGFGVHALNTHRHLHQLCELTGIGYTSSDIRNFQKAVKASSIIAASNKEDEIVNICIGGSTLLAAKLLKKIKGKRVIYTFFESNILPDGWKESLESADLVLTASEWGAEILRNALLNTTIEVVPLGIDINQFHHWNRNALPSTHKTRERKDEFRFLSIGKLEDRKGTRELLEAFKMAFSTKKHIKLILKIHNMSDDKYLQHFERMLPSEIADQVTLAKNEVNQDALSTKEIAELYRSSHCFVFPSKAEGWGLPLLEAISCGTPFIATHYSGQTEYLKHLSQTYSEIAYTMEDINSEDFFRFHKFTGKTRPQWAKPDISLLSKCMKDIYNNYDNLPEEAIANSQLVRKLFSWKASSETLLDTLFQHFS